MLHLRKTVPITNNVPPHTCYPLDARSINCARYYLPTTTTVKPNVMNPFTLRLSTMTRTLCMMCLVLWTSACTISRHSVPPANTTSHTRTNSQQYDSTYHRDSIYIREYSLGDTVYIDRWRDRWLERLVIRNDTIYQDRKVIIHSPPEKYIPRIVKWLAWVGVSATIALLLRLLRKNTLLIRPIRGETALSYVYLTCILRICTIVDSGIVCRNITSIRYKT